MRTSLLLNCFLFGSLFGSLLSAPARAIIDLPPCTPSMAAGVQCLYGIEKLRPTQPEVGHYEVEGKIDEYSKLSPKKMEETLLQKVVPVIIGPDGNLYLIDHHHTSLALWESGQENVVIQVKENWSGLAPQEKMLERMKQFWKKMDETHYCYLKLSDGTPIDPLSDHFAKNLKQCGNNPYRSFVDILSDDHVLKEGTIPYYEFYVGEILRREGLVLPSGKITRHDWKKFEKQAKKILKRDDVKSTLKLLYHADVSCDLRAILAHLIP